MSVLVMLTLDETARGILWDFSLTVNQTPLPVQPHITMVEAKTTDEQTVITTVSKLAADVHPIDIEFDSIGCFPYDPATTFAAPVVTRALLDLHQQLADVIEALEPGQAHRYYQPGGWVPHCTLGREVPPDQLDRALAITRTLRLPLFAQGIGLDVVRYPENEVIASIPLGQPQ